MTINEIVSKVKKLELPPKSYVVFGSGPLAAAGLREAGDIDMLVTPELLAEFKTQGWQMTVKGPGDEPCTYEAFEAHDNWDFSPYSPTLEHLLKTAIAVDGIPFASLQEVRKWKEVSGRLKHYQDIELIDTYLSEKGEACDETRLTSRLVRQINRAADEWGVYLRSHAWSDLVKDKVPKQGGWGKVYELGDPLDRGDADLAICDMRHTAYGQPHYHPAGSAELYIILEGSLRMVLMDREWVASTGDVVVIPPLAAHYGVPDKELVMALVSMPPFKIENYIVLTETNADVGFGKSLFDSRIA